MDIMEIGAKWGFLALIIAALAWYVLYKDKQHREKDKQYREDIKQLMEGHKQEVKELMDGHKQEVKELTKAFDRLTGTVQNLIEQIKGV